jgi:DNA invertase Pin-like site-specific DNA recombinase
MPRRRRPVSNPLLAVAYCRVSTEEQALGPAAQRASIERWAAAHGVSIVAWHEDLGVSGGAELEDRPALQRALGELAVHGAGVLVVARRDRLARSVVNAATLERTVAGLGARIASADGTGEGDGPEAALMRAITDAFSAYERELLRARTRAALAVKKARGERVGQVPFGFTADEDGRLAPHEAEQATIARIRELAAEGRTMRGIVAELEAEGRQPRGVRWYPMTVLRVLEASEKAEAA